MPILDKIPYINRLFKNTGIGRDTSSLMMMVTPRIIIQEEEEEKLGVASYRNRPVLLVVTPSLSVPAQDRRRLVPQAGDDRFLMAARTTVVPSRTGENR